MDKQTDAKRRKPLSGLSMVGIVALAMVVGYIAGTRSDTILATVGPVFGIRASDKVLDLSSVNDVYQMLDANYDGELDQKKLIEGAKTGLVAAAGDKHTVYFDAKNATAFQNQLNGKVSGIGAEIGTRSDKPTILRVIDNSPAQKAGLQAKDTIVSVNDVIVAGKLPGEVAELIRGEMGTTVKVVIARDGKQHEYTITRAEVIDASVESKVIDGVGVMTIRRFDSDTAQLARQAAETFVKQGVKGVIIDLRDDSGGYLDGAKQIAGLWLNSGEVVSTETREGKQVDALYGSDNPILRSMKTVVLVNNGSASASEVLSGALNYYDRAQIVGETTYGKGTIQQVFNLADGAELKVTIARWNLPDGTNIDGAGIKPDVEVKLTADDLSADKDPQMDKALEIIEQ
jgi:carboxyl-terminal processing protease